MVLTSIEIQWSCYVWCIETVYFDSSIATGDKDVHGLKFANSGPIFCFNVGPAKITETLLF